MKEQLSIADYATGTLFSVRNLCMTQGCRRDHGHTVLELRWYYSEPTTVFAFVGQDERTGKSIEDFVTSRALIVEALRGGVGNCPVVGEGNVMCQLDSVRRQTLAIGFNGGYIVSVDRADLTEWIMGTYVHVPSDQEETILDIDRLVRQLLNSN